MNELLLAAGIAGAAIGWILGRISAMPTLSRYYAEIEALRNRVGTQLDELRAEAERLRKARQALRTVDDFISWEPPDLALAGECIHRALRGD